MIDGNLDIFQDSWTNYALMVDKTFPVQFDCLLPQFVLLRLIWVLFLPTEKHFCDLFLMLQQSNMKVRLSNYRVHLQSVH